MKTVKRIGILFLIVLPLFTSCADLGAGLEEDYVNYFSSVTLMTPNGNNTMRMSAFYEAIDLGESDHLIDAVDYDDYRLIAFKVANGYTLTISEFAFFLHTEEKSASLEFDFYVTDKLPSKVNGNEETADPEGTTAPDELTEEDVFGSLESYHNAFFSIDREWDSTHLEFDSPQTVEAGEYVVIRIVNNTCTCGEETPEPAIPFAFNYFLFYIDSVD